MMALLLFLIVTCETSVLIGAQQTVSREEIAGRDNCAQCHVEELHALERSSHDQKAWSLLDHPKAAGYAKAVGVTDIKVSLSALNATVPTKICTIVPRT